MILIVDIDHTVSDAAWREPLIASNGWDFYHEQAHRDKPIDEIVALVRTFQDGGWDIAGVTARPERYRKPTMRWLVRNTIPMDIVLMRDDKDWRPSPAVKLDLIKKLPLVHPVLMIDDREDICLAMQAAGITTLQARRKDNVNG